MLGYLELDAMNSRLDPSHCTAWPELPVCCNQLRISSKCWSPAQGEFFSWQASLAAGNKTHAPQRAKIHRGSMSP